MTAPLQIRVKLWFQRDAEILLGLGATMLLQRIDELGSLKKASESLGMSYRAAWGRIKRAEAAMGVDLIENVGAKRDGCRLTPAGREAMDAFLAWYEDVYTHAVERAKVLPFVCRPRPPRSQNIE